MVATASGDWTVRLWGVEKGQIIYIYLCIGSVKDCSFSPLGKIIAAGDTGGNVYILELIGFGATSLAEGKEAVPEQTVEEAREKELPELKADEEKKEKLPESREEFLLKADQIIEREQEAITSSESPTISCKCGHNNPATERWCKNCGREL